MISTYTHISNDDFAGLLDSLIDYALKAEAAYVAVPAIPPSDGQNQLIPC
jgi:hypothetical protein